MTKMNIVIGKSEEFSRVYANVVRVQRTPADCRLIFYLDCPREPVSDFILGEKIEHEDRVIIDRLSQVEVILPLNVARSFSDILTKNLQKSAKNPSEKNDDQGSIYT